MHLLNSIRMFSRHGIFDNPPFTVITIRNPAHDLPIRDSAEDHPLLKKFKFGQTMEVLFDSSLGKVLKNIMSEAICSGKVAKSSIINMNIRSLQADDLGTLLQPDVNRILGLAKPSPFGQGNETVFDENVRKGLELVASQFFIAHEDELLRGIREQIQQKLFPLLPGGPESVTLKRYKMAIYQEGGHFQFHRDSLHADNHQATLLLEVRSAHEGGKFVIDHYGGKTKKIKGIDEYGNIKKYDAIFEMGFDKTGSVSTPLKWLAFYTDALHKVERVTSGTRIVIQYDVYVDIEMQVAIKKFHDSRGNPNDKDHDSNEDGDDDSYDDRLSLEKHYEDNEDDSDDNDHEDSSEDNEEEETDDDDDYDDDYDFQDEDEDEDDKNRDIYLDNISRVFNSYRFPCVPNIAIQQVLKELQELIATCGTKNVAIPLFHRYSSASVQREFLKGPDRLLFDAIVKQKKYVLGLSPVVMTVESEEGGYFNKKSYSVTFTDPMTVSYHWDAKTKDILVKPIKKVHKLNSKGCTYVVSEREEFWEIVTSYYKERVGSEGEEALHKYFLGVMVVSPI